MYKWNLQSKTLPLKFTWKISRGASTEKHLLFVELQQGDHIALGEIAGITADERKLDTLQNGYQSFKMNPTIDIEEIQNKPFPSHLRFGITSALTHLKAQTQGQTLHEYLGLRDVTPITTSFSMPILPLDEIGEFFNKFNLSRFQVLKLKISQDQPVEACQELARHYSGPLRVDANEAFHSAEQVLQFTQGISNLNIQFIEEPMPRGSVEEYKKLKLKSPFPIFADESVQSELLSASIRDQFHGINVKLMKAGSYQRARAQIEQAIQWKMETMLGCMVESTLGIAGAMAIAEGVNHFDLDGFLYFNDEPFHLVTENQGKLTYRHNPQFPLIF